MGPIDRRVADVNRRIGDTRSTVAEATSVLQPTLDGLVARLEAHIQAEAEALDYAVAEFRRVTASISEIQALRAEIGFRGAEIEALRGEIGAEIEALRGEIGTLGARVDTAHEHLGQNLRQDIAALGVRLAGTAADMSEALGILGERVDSTRRQAYVELLNEAAEADLADLDGALAHVINVANGHRGFAAQAGLWFNPAVNVELGEASATLSTVNERIVELPFALGQLASLESPGPVLDIGASESTFSLSAASLGYEVTALDPQGLSYRHPNLRVIEQTLEEWTASRRKFAAAFFISAIEHFGLGAYGLPVTDERADQAALKRVRGLLRENGLLVITTPYGDPSVDEFQRVYDDAGLDELLEGWEIIHRQTVVTDDDQTWCPGRGGTAGTALIAAKPAPPE